MSVSTGKRIARLDASGNAFYYLEDHLGTSRVIARSDGTVCYDADYFPFGGERLVTDTCPQPYKCYNTRAAGVSLRQPARRHHPEPEL